MEKAKNITAIILGALLIIVVVGAPVYMFVSAYNTPTKTASENVAPQDCDIKGNINETGEKIYHLPSDKYYQETDIDTLAGERYFCTEKDAQDSGWRHSEI